MRNPTRIDTQHDALAWLPDNAWQATMQPDPVGRPGVWAMANAATAELATIRLIEHVIERELVTTPEFAADLVARAVAARSGEAYAGELDRIRATSPELAQWVGVEVDRLAPVDLFLRIGAATVGEPEGCPSCDGTMAPPRHEGTCPALQLAAASS